MSWSAPEALTVELRTNASTLFVILFSTAASPIDALELSARAEGEREREAAGVGLDRRLVGRVDVHAAVGRIPHFVGSASFAFEIDASTVFVIELPEPAPAPLIVNVPFSGVCVGSPEAAVIAAAIVIASTAIVDEAVTRTSRFASIVESDTRGARARRDDVDADRDADGEREASAPAVEADRQRDAARVDRVRGLVRRLDVGVALVGLELAPDHARRRIARDRVDPDGPGQREVDAEGADVARLADVGLAGGEGGGTTARTFGLTSTSTWIESAVASVESRCASVASLRTFTATEIANAPVTSMPLACGAVFCCGCTVSLGIEAPPMTSARMLPFVSAATWLAFDVDGREAGRRRIVVRVEAADECARRAVGDVDPDRDADAELLRPDERAAERVPVERVDRVHLDGAAGDLGRRRDPRARVGMEDADGDARGDSPLGRERADVADRDRVEVLLGLDFNPPSGPVCTSALTMLANVWTGMIVARSSFGSSRPRTCVYRIPGRSPSSPRRRTER